MIPAQPVIDKEEYAEGFTAEAIDYLRETIFEPIQAILEQNDFTLADVTNAKDKARQSIDQALTNGTIWYAQGLFQGKFNASLSKQLRDAGAVKDKATGGYRLPIARMPIELRSVIGTSKQRAEKLHQELIKFLNEALRNVSKVGTGIDPTPALAKMRKDLDKQFKASLDITAQMNDGIRKVIEEQFTNNFNLAIKNIAEKELPKLRDAVERNAFAGYRSDRLARLLEVHYGMSKRRATFVARQETSLLVSKHRQERYTQAGVRKYRWSTSALDSRVRDDHRELHGRIFTWDAPPITDRRTGRKCHPGEDFGCRCVAIPIVEFED